jgi:hypothetical protein
VTTTYQDLLSAYLSDPGPATLDALRRAVRSAPNFRSDLTLDRTVDPLMARGAYDEAIDALRGLMPGAIFSPGVHARLSEALSHTGHQQAADREAVLAKAAIRSILSTGDGTAERPWSVLRVSDEYDVLRSKRKKPRQQEVVEAGDRHLDHHVCDDGSSLYFDVTNLFTRN